jgi:hypothetical protein
MAQTRTRILSTRGQRAMVRPELNLIARTMSLPDRTIGIGRWNTGLSPEILQAIGKLAVVSANVEQLLHVIYWMHAGLTGETGPIATSDLGPKSLTESIVKLVKLDPAKANILSDLQLLFVEFRAVVKRRNQCIHWIWSIQGQTPEMEKAPPHKLIRPMYKQGGEPEVEFDVTAIEQLYDDYAWLEVRLTSHATHPDVLRSKRAEWDATGVIKITGSDGERVQRFSDMFLPAPWLDKPLPPIPTPVQRRTKRT